MADRISVLRDAGYSEEQIGQWAAERRSILSGAGYPENEIDAYFTNGVVAPDKPPLAFENRIEQGNEARKREGGLMQTIPQGIALISTPEGRGKLWESVKNFPSRFVNDTIETLKVPGDVASGKIDLSTEEGMEKAMGLGMLVGFGRPNKLATSGKTSGLSVAMGEKVARIERSPTGEIQDLPIGGFPDSSDFLNAAKVVTEGDAPKGVQEKLLRTYEEEGRHPAETAHDAGNDPIVAQRLLSKDADVVPYASEKATGEGKPPEPPEPPKPPAEPPAPPLESYEAAQDKIIKRLSIGEPEPGRPLTFERLYRELIDDLHPLKAVTENGYELARLTRGQFGKAEFFLEQSTFDFKTYRNNGKPLQEILEPVSKDLDGLRAFLASKRALEIEATGRKSGMDLEAAQKIATEGAGKYGKIADELVGYQNRVLAYLRDSGVLSAEAYTGMVEAGKNYVPFYRLIDAEARGPKTGTSLGPGSPVKALKGSERIVVDPLESIIKNTYAYISVAERNAAGIEIVDALKKMGYESKAERVPRAPELIDYLKEQGITEPEKLTDFIHNAMPEKGDNISAFRDGVRESVAVNDPELVAAYRGLDRQSVGLLTKIFAIPARALRAGAVLTPEFMSRNLIRDFLTAFINSKGLFTPLDTIAGLKSVIRKDADYQAWVKAGGANSTFVAMDRAYMQESLAKLNGETGLMERGWNVIKLPITGTFRGLRLLSELTENATRVGEFRKALAGETSKEAMQSAAFASREVTLDFARMGAKMRAYNMLTAFANASIQGTDRMVRAFKDRPVNTTAKIAGGITVPSVLLWWANHDDERYKELPAWQRDLFWIIPTDKWEPISPADAASKPAHLIRQRDGKTEFNNGSIWRIPKPFEPGIIFGSGVERALDAIVGGSEQAFKDFSKSVMQGLTPNYIPTAVQPVIEQFANRSSFTDRTLIPADMEKHLPEYQYTPYTTQLSRKLGQIISAFPGVREEAVTPGANFGGAARALTTPILIENYVRSWSGGLGIYVMNAADLALRKAGVLPDPITPTPTLADIPFVKAFAVRYPSANTQSIQDFYDDYARNERFFKTFMAKAKEGDAEAVSRIQEAGGPRMFAQLDAIKETLSEHSKLIRDIYKNPTMPADEKRQLIDSLYYNMIQIGKGGKDMMRQLDRGLKSQTKETAPVVPRAEGVSLEGENLGHAVFGGTRG